MSRSLVSVVICTYNQQAFVRETLGSVLAQTYPNVEIIVTDDGSTDDTPAILGALGHQHPGHISVVLSERNTGIPANINRGLQKRTGEYLVILDGDDVMTAQKIERQVAFLEAHPEATGCYHDADVFDSDTGQSLGRMSVLYNGTHSLRQGKLKDWFVPRNFFLPSSIMSRSSTIPAHGFDERLKYLSEVVFYAEVYRRGMLLAMDDILVRYRRHTRNVTGNTAALNTMHEYEMIAYTILEARYPDMHPLLHRLRISCQLSAALKAYREGDDERFRRIADNVIRSGAPLKGLAVQVGAPLMGRHTVEWTGGSTQTRPSWVKRMARRMLQG